MNYFKKIYSNKKLLCCYLLFILSICFAIFLFLFHPKKLGDYYPFEYSSENINVVKFPIEQHFHNPYNSLRLIKLYLRDDSLNNYNYTVDVIGEKSGKNYFSHLYTDYSSDILMLDILDFPQEENDFILRITCDECEDVAVSKRKSNNIKENYITGSNDDNILEFGIVNFIPNNDYYWYSFVGIVLSLMFYSLAKGEINDEEK